ncbi:MAG: hypothetical protein WAK40_04115 [Thermoplasmata archaeon]
MGSSPNTIPRTGWSAEPGMLHPDEEAALEERLERVRQEKADALKDPGPNWTEWFCYTAAKWYLALAVYLVLLVWEVGYLLPTEGPPSYLVLPIIALTLYGEFLFWRYLWYRPTDHEVERERSRSTHDGRFHPTWLRPVQFGRWTPEAAMIRAGGSVVSSGTGPDPKEFL